MIGQLPGDTPSLLSQLRVLVASPSISTRAVSSFLARLNPDTSAVDVTFTLADATGVASVSLSRSLSADPATALFVQSWSPALEMSYAFPDSAAFAAAAAAYYYLTLTPTGTSGTAALVGPVSVALNPNLALPGTPLSISAGHGSASNGTVPVYVTVGGQDTNASLQVYVVGYQGSPSPVLVATASSSPLTFSLLATGETVQVYAQAVNAAGISSAASPSTSLTLSPAPTVPPAPPAPVITQTPTGNQVAFQRSPDPTVTQYLLYRGQRGDPAFSATLLATIAASSASTIVYLDTAGLSGDFAYYVRAQNPVGQSDLSPAGTPPVTLTSATLPPNVPGNVNNNATVDSVAASGSALVRVYGPSGPGTSYLHYTGFGSLTRPNGSLSGLSFTTRYAVVYDTLTKAYGAFTLDQYSATLPDRYEFVGYVTTTSNGTATGSGATLNTVIDSGGHVIQANPLTVGSGYTAADVSLGGGGGSDAQVTANVAPDGTIPSYTVTNGGSGYTSPPAATVVPVASGGSTGGGGEYDGGGGRYPIDQYRTY